MNFPEYLTFGAKGFADELFIGALRALEIAFFAYLLGILVGMLGALGKLYGPRWLAWLFEAYTTVFRAVPPLVLILLLYFAGTDGINKLLGIGGFGPIAINGLFAAIAVLGIVQGAYATEVIRAAIQAIPKGQIEAAWAYGMSGWKLLQRIVLPAMLPNALPGLTNLWQVVMKETALIAVVGASPELAAATKNAAGYTKHYLVFYLVAGAIYLVITLASNQIISFIELRLRRGQPKTA